MMEANMAYCPYCLGHLEKTVVCEGFGPGETMLQRFGTARAKDGWYLQVCCEKACFTLCPAAAALNALWDEELPDVAETVRRLPPDRRKKLKASLARRARCGGSYQ